MKPALGRTLYDPDDPIGKMFRNILATLAESEAGLIRMGAREGMAIARDKGKLRGRQPNGKIGDLGRNRRDRLRLPVVLCQISLVEALNCDQTTTMPFESGNRATAAAGRPSVDDSPPPTARIRPSSPTSLDRTRQGVAGQASTVHANSRQGASVKRRLTGRTGAGGHSERWPG